MNLDEVDLILHPLKSELNWPLGGKEPLDFTRSQIGNGLRWAVPFHLLNAIFYYTERKVPPDFVASREARLVLEELSAKIAIGKEQKLIQTTPHVVLLSRSFYTKVLKPIMARWALLFLLQRRFNGVTEKQLLAYLMGGPAGDPEGTKAVKDNLGDEHTKMLNLMCDWLRSFLPFVLGKIDRVTFGLLQPDDLERALQIDPKMPKNRKLLAVPFVGKDLPSRASEFAHPDVVIGLTILAYRYEGLRRTDFMVMMRALREAMDDEYGPYPRRPSCMTFVEWVDQAGGKVRGTRREIRLLLLNP